MGQRNATEAPSPVPEKLATVDGFDWVTSHFKGNLL
jgi:hypothetical protein